MQRRCQQNHSFSINGEGSGNRQLKTLLSKTITYRRLLLAVSLVALIQHDLDMHKYIFGFYYHRISVNYFLPVFVVTVLMSAYFPLRLNNE